MLANPFVARSGGSGTHTTELNLWRAAGLDPAKPKPAWYHEIAEGTGAALKTARAMIAHVLCDRSAWIFFTNKAELENIVEGDWWLFNEYVIILVKSD